MNKDHKAIARILNESVSNIHTSKIAIAHNKCVAYRLADYFDGQQYITGVYIKFDKKQFLKDCGVKE